MPASRANLGTRPAAGTGPRPRGRAQRDADRQAALERLRAQHPDWPDERLLFAALAEEHGEADADFLRQAAEHIAEWSNRQGVNLTRRDS